MIRNIRLTIEYDGTGFCGWQTQAGRKIRTVQEEIEKACRKLFGKRVRLAGSGRTDTGVHAEAQVANFKIDSKIPSEKIKRGLNDHLPKDISILSAEDVSIDFHARFDAKEKLYRYTILNRKERSPILARYVTRVAYDLDIGAMKKAAKYLTGKKDFRSFQTGDRKKRASVRTVRRLDITYKRPLIELYIQSDGFLYNMVRNIVGTLIDVGRGKLKPETVKEILAKRSRKFAGWTVPSKGLCLVKVFY